MLAPEVEGRPWPEQVALDDEAYRAQLAYLFDRSAFYREKLTAAGIASGEAAGGLADIARLLERDDPLTAVKHIRKANGKVPGFGHPVHKPLDPRAERILELADERGAAGPHCALARHMRDAAAEAWGRPLTMNVSMPIAATMLDLGFPATTVKAIPILARTASLLAHLAEERDHPIGFVMAAKAEEAIEYER